MVIVFVEKQNNQKGLIPAIWNQSFLGFYRTQ